MKEHANAATRTKEKVESLLQATNAMMKANQEESDKRFRDKNARVAEMNKNLDNRLRAIENSSSSVTTDPLPLDEEEDTYGFLARDNQMQKETEKASRKRKAKFCTWAD